MNKKKIGFILLSFFVVVFVFFLLFLRFGDGNNFIGKFLNDGKMFFPVITVSALIDSVNPCAFSVLLLSIAFLFSAGKTRGVILKMGIIYIVGIFIVYLLIGLGILQTLHVFNTPHFMARVGASVIIFFGVLSVLNDIFPSFPIKLKIPKVAHSTMAKLMGKASFPASFLLGVFVGLSEFPCTGGPYLMALGFLHDHATFWKGFWYLTWYNFVFIFPLIVVLLMASNEILLKKTDNWRKENTHNMRLYGGVAMIVLGILIFIL